MDLDNDRVYDRPRDGDRECEYDLDLERECSRPEQVEHERELTDSEPEGDPSLAAGNAGGAGLGRFWRCSRMSSVRIPNPILVK